ncbi:thiolase domain-containing protein [Paracoccus sp. J55]|uniref:thiolase domain-containing protein n=1 Tax=Paracoccus sp. J55 TaxID=935849 RepID=UPI00048A78A1|nr:thiolase domain-containing protein [Paracoccus sp. J55]
MASDISDICIIGTGHTRFGRLDDNLETLIVTASREALHEAGLSGDAIDAIFISHFNSGLVRDSFVSSLVLQTDPGLRFKPSTRVENACASGTAAIHAGMAAILAGQAKRVLVVGAEKMTSRSTPEVTEALAGAGYQNNPAEAALSFPGVFALAAQAYGERHGDPLPAMAQIASKNHMNAMANPLAHMRRPMTVADCATIGDRNPVVAPPLRLTDCSLVSDGAAALVLTSTDLAQGHEHVARFRAAVQVNDLLPMSLRDLAAFEGPARAIRRAYSEAGIGVDDLGFAEVHDCFTIAELMIYEAMGLAEAGNGAEAIASGRVLREGRTPVNLSGGLKAKGHPIGATGVSMHVMAFRQLTGNAGEIQAPNPRAGLVFNMGGVAVANYASILSSC